MGGMLCLAGMIVIIYAPRTWGKRRQESQVYGQQKAHEEISIGARP